MASYEFEFPFFGFWGPFFEEGRSSLPHGGLDLYETKEGLVVEAPAPGQRKKRFQWRSRTGF